MGLGKEGGEGDVDTVRLILETLLMLFNPDEASPEASEDIALWLADEFSQVRRRHTLLWTFYGYCTSAKVFGLDKRPVHVQARPLKLSEWSLSASVKLEQSFCFPLSLQPTPPLLLLHYVSETAASLIAVLCSIGFLVQRLS